VAVKGKIMSNHRFGHTRWATAAQLGMLQWIGGNLYEAAVNMPRLLADAQPNRRPGLLAAGSPLRYYLPTAPFVFIAGVAALIHDWRAGGNRLAIVAAATGTASSAALTAYLVGALNLRLVRGEMPLDADETDRLIKTWHRGNLMRMVCLAVAACGSRRAAGASGRGESALRVPGVARRCS
jgi:Domain of unknown function (DUF1772)